MNVYTIGYEGADLGGVIGWLKDAEVRLIVDVRDAPISRKRGFSKKALADALRSEQIDYEHRRALGCPKTIRDRYRAERDWAAYTAAFMAHLAGQASAVSEAASLCATRRSALLCYESDPMCCHRSYVARAVAALTGGKVLHIGASGIVPDSRAGRGES